MRRRLLLWLPFTIGAALFAAFWIGLRHPDDHVIASRMIGQPLPEFTTRAAVAGHDATGSAQFRDGRPRLLNVFASWCIPCAQEGQMLMRLKAAGAEIDGVAVHDTEPDVAQFLAENGNPYASIGLDVEGKAQMALGSTGVPETFVVDGQGRIIHQHMGAVAETDMPVLLQKLGIRP